MMRHGISGLIAMIVMVGCLIGLGAHLFSAPDKTAEAAEPDRLRQLTQSVSELQKENRSLKAKISVLEKLPTAKKELAAKKAADRRRRR